MTTLRWTAGLVSTLLVVGGARAHEIPTHLNITRVAVDFLVAKDDRVPAALEHDVEVAPVDGLLRPPAVDDPPLLAHERHPLPVDPARRPVEPRLDERQPRVVYSSRGTSSARASGIRDHGATSTTVQTEPVPVAART